MPNGIRKKTARPADEGFDPERWCNSEECAYIDPTRTQHYANRPFTHPPHKHDPDGTVLRPFWRGGDDHGFVRVEGVTFDA